MTIVNIHAYIRAPKYIKKILTDLERNIEKTIVVDFNTPLSTMGRPVRQKINKETLDLN